MQLAVRAFPVRPGYEDKAHHVARQMQGQRAAEAADFYRRHGVVRETWHTQETPAGLWIIAVTQFDQKPVEEAAREYAASQAPFDRWFKDQVKALTGIDPDTAPLGPPTECIFDSAIAQAARAEPG